jgi:topoisomerase-4 subunit A
MLVFGLDALPQLAKGKGNKIIGIPSERAKLREELLIHLQLVPAESPVTLWAGKRKLTLKSADLEHYRGERGRRGAKLPRGLQRVDRVELGEGDTPVL